MKNIFCTTLLAGAMAAVLPVSAKTAITSITGSPSFASPTTPINVDTELTSVTTSEDTYEYLYASSVEDIGEVNTWFYQQTNPGSATAALSSLIITDSVANITTANVIFGSEVTETSDFFLIEIGGNDDFTLQPIDSSKNPIGTYTMTITSADYGGTIFTVQAPNKGNGSSPGSDQAYGGVVFNLGDLAGSGDLSDFSGFAIDGGGSADLVKLGAMSTIPEPSGFAMIGGLLLLVWVVLRRIK